VNRMSYVSLNGNWLGDRDLEIAVVCYRTLSQRVSSKTYYENPW
jgi:hypothetical protein